MRPGEVFAVPSVPLERGPHGHPVHISPRSSGSRKYPYPERGCGGISKASNVVLRREGLLGYVAASSKGILPGKNPVSFAAHRYWLQVSRDDKVPRPDLH